jgi:hypothetical protein
MSGMTAPKTRTRKARAAEPATVELPDLDAGGEAGGETQPGSSDTTTDLEAIFPDPAALTVLGIPATVRRLQTREIMAAIRILVDQMGSGITQFDLDKPFEDQKTELVSMLFVAVPDAADEVLKLLSGLVEARDPEQQKTIEAIMYNPPPAVTIDIVGVVFEQEREDFAALVGKVRPLLGYAQALQRTGKAGT